MAPLGYACPRSGLVRSPDHEARTRLDVSLLCAPCVAVWCVPRRPPLPFVRGTSGEELQLQGTRSSPPASLIPFNQPPPPPSHSLHPFRG